jgi:F-box/leucine-rich repeat protein 2/20
MGAIASSCKGLRTLKMEACNLVSEEGLELIGNGCPNLEELDFTDCSVNDNG